MVFSDRNFSDDVPDRMHHPSCELHERNAMLRDSDEKHRPNVFDNFAFALGMARRSLFTCLVLVTMVIVLFIVVCVMSANYPTPEKQTTVATCDSVGCLLAAAQMKQLLSGNANLTSMTCDTAWSQVCSVWSEQQQQQQQQLVKEEEDSPSAAAAVPSLVQQLRDKENDRLQTLLTRPTHLSSSSATLQLSLLYESCVKDSNSAATYRDFFLPAFGFQVNRGQLVSSNVSWPDLFKTLQQQAVASLVTVRVVHDRQSGRLVIQLSPGKLILESWRLYTLDDSDTIVKAYQQYVAGQLTRLGVAPERAASVARDLWGFERRLADKMAPCGLGSGGAAPCFGATSLNNSTLMAVHQLQELTHRINWLDILNTLYPDYAVNRTTQVLVVHSDYFGSMMRIVSSSLENVVNEYMLWSHMTHYLPLLNGASSAAYRRFNDKVSGVDVIRTRWQECSYRTRQLLPLASTAALGVSGTPTLARSRPVLQSMFDSLKKTVTQFLSFSSLVASEDRVAIVARVGRLSLLVGWPDRFASLQNGELDARYGKLSLVSDRFLENIYKIMSRRRLIESKVLSKQDLQMSLAAVLSGDELAYSDIDSSVVVPSHLLQPPLFRPDFPPALLFGGLATRLAGAILSSVSSVSSSSSRLLDCSSSSAAAAAHRSRRYCRCVQHALHSLPSSPPPHADEQTLSHAALSLLAFRMAFEAFEVRTEIDGVRRLTGLEQLSPQQLMLVQYGISLCSPKTDGQIRWQNLTSSLIDSSTLVKLLASQYDQWSQQLPCVRPGPSGAGATTNNNNSNSNNIAYCHAL